MLLNGIKCYWMLLNVINTIAVAMTVTIVIWYLILVFDIDMGLWYSLNYSVKTFFKKRLCALWVLTVTSTITISLFSSLLSLYD
jgi:hypothetical protein